MKLNTTIFLLFSLFICQQGTSQEEAPVPADDVNWVSTIAYNINGETLSKGVGFFNTLGKKTQSQSWDVLSGKVWGNQIIYDEFGRPSLQSLSAPLNNTSFFGIDNSLILDANGNEYNLDDFSVSTYNWDPSAVSPSSKLGAYYWNNISEDYQDNTEYPFTLVEYSRLTPGVSKKVIGGNKINNQWLQTYSFNMQAGDELSTNNAFGSSENQYDYMKVNKTVSRDAHGIETVVFTNYDGDVLALARSGNEEGNNPGSETNTIKIGPQGWVDIHISQGCSENVFFSRVSYGNTDGGNTDGGNTDGGTDGEEEVISNVLESRIASYESDTQNASKNSQEVQEDFQIMLNREVVQESLPEGVYFRVYDLITEEVVMQVPTGTIQLSNGFYRVELRHGTNMDLNGFNYHTSYNLTENPELFNLDTYVYKVRHCQNYYDYSLNDYDKSGRLLKSTQPRGSNLGSLFTYNSLGQLQSASSPDEGSAEFIYRKDGQIRFSQNSKQQLNDEFSYTTYDHIARPVESGVYRSSDVLFYLRSQSTEDPGSTLPSDLIPEIIVPVFVENMDITVDVYGTEYRKQTVLGDWNGGFASQQILQEDGKLQFKPGDLDGDIIEDLEEGYEVIVGFTPPEDAADEAYTNIKYGISLYIPSQNPSANFYISQVRIYQNGDYLRNDANQILSYGSFVETDVFSIKRENGVIKYYKNDEEIPVTLLLGDTNYTEPLVVDASFKKDLNAINSLMLFRAEVTVPNSDIDIYSLVEQEQDDLNDSNCYEQHFTLYDIPDPILEVALSKCGLPYRAYDQTFLSGNVSRTQTKKPSTTTSWYSYDVYGRVKWIIQEVDGLNCLKTIDYTYDPVTGQVLRVDYQRHMKEERFVHNYEYNVGGQLVKVSTSLNGLDFTEQAEYEYNETGQLIRTELADNLQGIDYVYNLNGQLKAINHPSLNPSNDPGHDGTNGFIADVFGMTLNYYDGDYSRTNTPTPIETTGISNAQDQFNGNIKAQKWQTQSGQPSTYSYSYNKNNWLTQAEFSNPEVANNEDYKVSNITYDANGNIETLKRNGFTDENGSNDMDDFTYNYYGAKNQLNHITDANDNSISNRYNDLKTQGFNNYVYNSIGQLVFNEQDNVLYEYNASGLVTKINAFSNTNTDTYHTLFKQDYEAMERYDGLLWEVNTGFMRFVRAHQADQVDTLIDSANNMFLPGDGPELYEVALPPYCLNFDMADDPYETRRQFNFYQNSDTSPNQFKVQTTLKTLEDAYHKFDFDLLLYQQQINSLVLEGDLPNKTPITAEATVTLTQDDGTIIQTFTIDPLTETMSHCDRIVKHLSFEFLSTGTKVHLSIDVDNNGATTELLSASQYAKLHQSIEVDNIHLQVANAPKVAFYYNDRGQRVRKEVYQTGMPYTDITYYVRDVAGNALAIYNKPPGRSSSESLIPKEHSIYGAGRIGVHYKDGSKFGTTVYQLADHLGNVRAVILKSGTNALSLTSKTDYYPFGMAMPNRNIEGNYRYGYQGEFAEKDAETGLNAFELRLWDSRIGRWTSSDPHGQFASPYLGMANNPINGVDPDGGKFVASPKAAKLWNKYKALLRLTERGKEYVDAVDADENWIVNVLAPDEGDQEAWSYDDESKTLKLGEFNSGFKLIVWFAESKWAYHHSSTALAGHEVAHAYHHWWYVQEYGPKAFEEYLYRKDSNGKKWQKKSSRSEMEKFGVQFQNYIYSVFTGGDVFRNEYNGYLDDPIWENPSTKTFNPSFERINFGIPFQDFNLPTIFSRTLGKENCGCN